MYITTLGASTSTEVQQLIQFLSINVTEIATIRKLQLWIKYLKLYVRKLKEIKIEGFENLIKIQTRVTSL